MGRDFKSGSAKLEIASITSQRAHLRDSIKYHCMLGFGIRNKSSLFLRRIKGSHYL